MKPTNQEIRERHDECSCGGKMLGMIRKDAKGNKYVVDDPEKAQAHEHRGILLKCLEDMPCYMSWFGYKETDGEPADCRCEHGDETWRYCPVCKLTLES